MKENLMKTFALATIDKVQELTAAAENAGLYLSVEVNISTESTTISIYEKDRDGKLVTPSVFFKHGSYLDARGCKQFAAQLEETAGYIAGYTAKDLARLEKKQAELRAQLAEVGKDLRKVRRAAK